MPSVQQQPFLGFVVTFLAAGAAGAATVVYAGWAYSIAGCTYSTAGCTYSTAGAAIVVYAGCTYSTAGAAIVVYAGCA
jgi:hypothetical protein